MGVLNALMTLGHVKEEDLNAVLPLAVEAVKKQEELWFEEDGERKLDLSSGNDQEAVLAAALEAISTVQVPVEALQHVKKMYFDGGNEIYMWFESAVATALGLEDWELDTGGESELYVIKSFAGIGALTSLESLSLDAYGWSSDERDMTPFADLPSIVTLQLMGAPFQNSACLLQVKSLRKVEGAGKLDPEVVADLQKAGVEIK